MYFLKDKIHLQRTEKHFQFSKCLYLPKYITEVTYELFLFNQGNFIELCFADSA